MSQTIWKYLLQEEDTQMLKIPKGAKILSVINLEKDMYIYVQLDSDEKHTDKYRFETYGTGDEIRHDNSYTFLGTVKMLQDRYVVHVFYKKI